MWWYNDRLKFVNVGTHDSTAPRHEYLLVKKRNEDGKRGTKIRQSTHLELGKFETVKLVNLPLFKAGSSRVFSCLGIGNQFQFVSSAVGNFLFSCMTCCRHLFIYRWVVLALLYWSSVVQSLRGELFLDEGLVTGPLSCTLARTGWLFTGSQLFSPDVCWINHNALWMINWKLTFVDVKIGQLVYL